MKNKKSINLLLDIVYIVLFGFSISLFWIGFHNEDLGHNMRYLEAEFNIELWDDAIGYDDFISGIDLMKIGRVQQTLALFCIFISSLYIGLMVTQKNEKR